MTTRSALLAAALLTALTFTASTASAQDGPAEPESRTLSVTISPFHLFVNFVELGVEYALTPQDGVMLYGGYGVPSGELSDGTTFEQPTIELGAQYRRYLLGNFDAGVHVGAEFQYLNVSTTVESSAIVVNAAGNAISPGLFVGAKYAFGFGLTSELQVGGAYNVLFLDGDGTDGVNTVTSSSQTASFGLLLNLNLGWTF